MLTECGFSRAAAYALPGLATRGAVFFVGWRLTPYPTYGPCHCELKISTLSPWLLKLPVLVASKSPGGAAAYRCYSTMRFGSPEKAQRAASGKNT
ncbi:hypothetical protein CEG88_01640 [Klebsiella aerogenes]|nr:hypothetical protein CEG88_01640 [Klebsiella aerogenes]